MFAHESWMSIFFRLFNFAALMALLAFIFRRYIYGGVVQGIVEEKQKEEGMQFQAVVLDKKGKELAQSTIRQEHETRFLLDRAVQWQATFKLDLEKRKHEQKVLCDASRARKKQQIQALESEKLMALVVPQALATARHKLVETFAQEKRGREYIEALLASMKKSL